MNIPHIVLLVIKYCAPNSFCLFLLLLYQEYNEIFGHVPDVSSYCPCHDHFGTSPNRTSATKATQGRESKATRADRWSSDGTSSALVWIDLGIHAGRMRRDEFRGAEEGMGGCPSIAKERSDSAYSWDIDRDGKTEEVGIGDKVE